MQRKPRRKARGTTVRLAKQAGERRHQSLMLLALRRGWLDRTIDLTAGSVAAYRGVMTGDYQRHLERARWHVCLHSPVGRENQQERVI